MTAADEEGFNEQMDNAVKGAILKAMEDDAEFRKRMTHLINKKDATDKDVEVHIGLPAIKVQDNEMSYTIATGRKLSEWSFTSLGSLAISKRLLIDLYYQLDKMVREI